MTTSIKIIDMPCGSDKKTAMINGFNNQDKYLIIVPLFSEVQPIFEHPNRVAYVEPIECEKIKEPEGLPIA